MNEQKHRVENDANLDGATDTWEFYEDGMLVRQEKDDNNDGQVDLRVFFENNEKKSLARDADYDGRFETFQRFDDPEWDMVMEQELYGDGTVDMRFFYRDGVLRQRR
ncbi:MAG: hypothetical protein R2860_05520 [Desulfobacterales bacterium]